MITLSVIPDNILFKLSLGVSNGARLQRVATVGRASADAHYVEGTRRRMKSFDPRLVGRLHTFSSGASRLRECALLS